MEGRIRGGGVAGRITREGDGAGVYPPLSTLPSSSSRAALQSGVTGSCKRLSFFVVVQCECSLLPNIAVEIPSRHSVCTYFRGPRPEKFPHKNDVAVCRLGRRVALQ